MKIIVINRRFDASRTLEIGRWTRALLSLCCLGLPLSMLAIGYLAGQHSGARSERLADIDGLHDEVERQAADLDALKARARSKNRALTASLAEMQARMTRLDALGDRLTSMAGMEPGEFDFSQPPAMGGPLAAAFNVEYDPTRLNTELGMFQSRLADREQQLELLASVLASHNLQEQKWLSGRPVEKGWLSSHYGQRIDPFTGELAIHKGLDFAGKAGSHVIAVAAGVVTWSGERSGYGQMVEISHGDGFVTRYAHNEENLVAAGDIVRKGQAIALMGSTGRSTGAHVHYEVYKNGRSVDPASYVRRTRR